MPYVQIGFATSIEISDAQFGEGQRAAAQPDATHYTVWLALKEAGVPVRDPEGYPASLAATALLARPLDIDWLQR